MRHGVEIPHTRITSINLLDFVSDLGISVGSGQTIGGKTGLIVKVITNFVKKSNNSVVELNISGELNASDYIGEIATDDVKEAIIGSDPELLNKFIDQLGFDKLKVIE